jgi:crotonobetainyl-CoA:carnitine CoA-transferase CaiB-like acyl-CoA transferase
MGFRSLSCAAPLMRRRHDQALPMALLEGVTVDLTTVMAGPTARWRSAMGASVIKVEFPRR